MKHVSNRRWLGLIVVLLSACSTATTDAREPTRTTTVGSSAQVDETTAGTSAGADPTTSDAGTTSPTADPVIIPAPSQALALTGDIAADAAAIIDAFDADPVVRASATLAAFQAAELPVLGVDDVSLTTSSPNDIGFRWDFVWSTTSLLRPETRLPLDQLLEVMHLVDPAGPYDVQAAADGLLAGLRSQLSAPTAVGPAFLAHLVAEDARRFGGVELADPAVTADQLSVHATTALLIMAGALEAAREHLFGAGGETVDATGGPSRPTHLGTDPAPVRPARISTAECADDGAGGWALFIVSKLAGGIAAPGLPLAWEGLYPELLMLLDSRGYNAGEAAEVLGAAYKYAGFAASLLNVFLFVSQVAGFHASASMDGTGPLVRTKTTSHGEPRTITLSIDYDDRDDPNAVTARNCILLLLGVAGNNSQIAVGHAAGVEVAISGGAGFANSLAAGDSIVLFGPAEFHPVQDADDLGRITVPVQGRGQRRQLPETVAAVSKTFSVLAEASLDPVNGSTIAKAFVDSALCVGVVNGGGSGTDSASECQNAATDILKRFHWDLGEFTFPLTDWRGDGWVVSGPVGPFTMGGSKCDGDTGDWIVSIQGSVDGLSYYSDLTFSIDPQTLLGTYSLVGSFSGGGVSLAQSGSGRVALVRDAEGAEHFEFQADVASLNTPVGSFGGAIAGGAIIPLTPADEDRCP